MFTRRSVAPLALASLIASGCGLALGLSDFTDAPTAAGAGGATSSSATTASATGGTATTSATAASVTTGGGATSTAATSSAGGSTASAGGGGAGGSGGAMPPTCLLIGQPFNLLTPTDVNGAIIDPKSLEIVADTANTIAYVSAVATQGAGGGSPSSSLFVRAVTDQAGSPAGNLGSYTAPPPNNNLQIYGGIAVNGLLRYFTQLQNAVTRVEFTIKNNSVTPLGLNPFGTSLTCDSTQGLRTFIPMPDAQGVLTYAATTLDNGGTNRITLCYGNETAGPTTLGTGVLSGTTGFNLLASDMLLVGGTTVLRSGSDGPGEIDYGFSTAPPAGLGTPHRFSLTSSTTESTAVFAEAPSADGKGLVVLGARISNGSAIVPASLWTGVVPLTQIGDLDTAPPPEFNKVLSFATVSDLNNIGQLGGPVYNATSLIIAGANFSETGAIFFKFSRDGALRIASFPVYPAAGAALPSGSAVLSARATFLGDMQVLVAWSEQNAAGDISVRGRTFLCGD